MFVEICSCSTAQLSVLFFRSFFCWFGSTWTTRSLWQSAQVLAGSSSVHCPNCPICSNGPHCQRWAQSPAALFDWSWFPVLTYSASALLIEHSVLSDLTFGSHLNICLLIAVRLCNTCMQCNVFCHIHQTVQSRNQILTPHTLFCHAAFFCCHKARNRISVVNRN